jgi:DNA-binding response OmpR family regulator
MGPMVWLVDDDVEFRTAMAQMFRMIGYEMRQFPEARAVGMALLAGEHPDLLFLDINMPHVSGLELLKFIRSREVFNKLPILMMTSESSDQMVEQAIRVGADGYIFKPVSFDELQMAIQTAIRRRHITASLKDKTKPVR